MLRCSVRRVENVRPRLHAANLIPTPRGRFFDGGKARRACEYETIRVRFPHDSEVSRNVLFRMLQSGIEEIALVAAGRGRPFTASKVKVVEDWLPAKAPPFHGIAALGKSEGNPSPASMPELDSGAGEGGGGGSSADVLT